MSFNRVHVARWVPSMRQLNTKAKKSLITFNNKNNTILYYIPREFPLFYRLKNTPRQRHLKDFIL